MTQSPVEFTLPPPSLGAGISGEQTLDIPYVKQTASNWCWATSAAMVSRFRLKTDLSICQVASTLIVGQDCCSGAPAETDAVSNADPSFIWTSTPCNRTVKVPEVAALYTKLGMQSTHRGTKIDFDTLCNQIITNGSPIQVALFWTGGGGHVAVVRGVDPDAKTVRINDPWPDTGEVVVPFDQLVTAYGKGQWFDCWTDIQKQPDSLPAGVPA